MYSSQIVVLAIHFHNLFCFEVIWVCWCYFKSCRPLAWSLFTLQTAFWRSLFCFSCFQHGNPFFCLKIPQKCPPSLLLGCCSLLLGDAWLAQLTKQEISVVVAVGGVLFREITLTNWRCSLISSVDIQERLRFNHISCVVCNYRRIRTVLSLWKNSPFIFKATWQKV